MFTFPTTFFASSTEPNWILNDLVSYYKFDWNANDAHGSNNGTINGATSTSSGKINDDYDFDGVNDYITIPDSADLTPVDFSINCWIKTSTTARSSILVKRNTSWFAWFIFEINTWAVWDIQLDIYDTADRYSRSTNVSINNWAWHMITVTCNHLNNINIFKDNVEVTYSVHRTWWFTNPNTNWVLNIWTWSPTPFGYYNWKIDEIWIWSKVLSTQEITDLYNSWSGLSYDDFTS